MSRNISIFVPYIPSYDRIGSNQGTAFRAEVKLHLDLTGTSEFERLTLLGRKVIQDAGKVFAEMAKRARFTRKLLTFRRKAC